MTTYKNTSEQFGAAVGGLTVEDYRKQAEINGDKSVITADDEHVYADGVEVGDAEREIGMKTTQAVLAKCGITLNELAIASHQQNYTKIIVHVENGKIYAAFATESINEYDCRPFGWTMLYKVGTGSCRCNCDACVEGDDPADWADGDYEVLAAIDEAIQDKIDALIG